MKIKEKMVGMVKFGGVGTSHEGEKDSDLRIW